MVVECPHARHTHQGWTDAEVAAALEACRIRYEAPPATAPPAQLTVAHALALGDVTEEQAAAIAAREAAAAEEEAHAEAPAS